MLATFKLCSGMEEALVLCGRKLCISKCAQTYRSGQVISSDFAGCDTPRESKAFSTNRKALETHSRGSTVGDVALQQYQWDRNGGTRSSQLEEMHCRGSLGIRSCRKRGWRTIFTQATKTRKSILRDRCYKRAARPTGWVGSNSKTSIETNAS